MAIQPLLLNALSLPVTAYIIRSLGAAGYGEWAIATATVSSFGVVANIGLRGHFVRSVARDPAIAADALALQLGVRISLAILGAVAACVTCLALGYSPTIIECTAIAAFTLLLTTVATTAADLLRAFRRLPELAAVNMVAGLALTAASLAAIMLHFGPVGLMTSYIVGPAICVFGGLRAIRRQHTTVSFRFDLRAFCGLIREARHFAIVQIVGAAGSYVDALVVPRLVGVSAFGYLTAGTLLPNRFSAVPDAIGTACYPSVARTYTEDRERAAREGVRWLSISLLGSIPIAVAVSSLARSVGDLLFPHHAAICAQVLRITIWSLPLMAIGDITYHCLNAVGQEAQQARVNLGAAVVSGLCTLALVSVFGLEGACWSWPIRHAVVAAFRIPYFAREFAPSIGRLPLGRIALSNTAMAAVMVLAAAVIPHAFQGASTGAANFSLGSRWLLLVASMSIQAGIGAAVYIAALIATGLVAATEIRVALRERLGRLAR